MFIKANNLAKKAQEKARKEMPQHTMIPRWNPETLLFIYFSLHQTLISVMLSHF